MKSFTKIIFLFVFVSSWGFTGGVFVRYPHLENSLNRISQENPLVSKEIRAHSNPSALCGVKAVVDSLGHVKNDLMKSILQLSHVLLPIDLFYLEEKNGSFSISNLSSPQAVQKFVLLPFSPPKINRV